MKRAPHSYLCSASLPLIALAALISAPQSASAQAVGGYMRGGGGGNTAPAQNTQNQPRAVQPQQVQQPQQPRYEQPQRQYSPMRSGAISNERPSNQIEPVFPTRIDTPPSYSRGPVVNVPDAAAYPSRSGSRYQERPNYNQPNTDLSYNPTRLVAPVGPANGFFNNSTPPVGPANGFFNNSTPPVGPANGYGNNSYSNNGYSNGPVRITTPQGPQYFSRHHDHDNYENNYVYNTVINPSPVYLGAPTLLGGYYYGNYCDSYVQNYTYPSVYSTYYGFPRFLFNPTVVVVSQPYCPIYTTSYLPFYPPLYPVTYNENNYYFTNEERTRDFEAGGDRAKEAIRNAYPADSYQAAFADIARGWSDSDIKLIRRHTRDTDTRLSVFLNKKYSYSIASGDFLQITRDALDRLNTVSFDFTRLRKAKNGDVTAFGKHIYRVSDSTTRSGGDGDTVPFDSNGSDTASSSPYSQSSDPTSGEKKTVYVSYTLHRKDDKWCIIAVDSSEHSLTASE